MKNPVSLLRVIAIVEAISFLILLGIAMPLKYIWHQPQAVKIIGMAHGVLFVAFCLSLALATRAARWPLSRAALLLLVSFIPIVPFFFDRKLQQWAAEHEQAPRPAQ